MSKKASKKSKKLRKLFDPTMIVDNVQSAINRDFSEAQHVYCLNDSETLYAFNRQVSEFQKKFDPGSPETTSDLEAQSIKKFLDVNEHMGVVNSKLRKKLVYSSTLNPDTLSTEDKIFLRARAIVRMVLGSIDEDEWFQECKNSGGTSRGVSFNDTSDDAKFTFPISTTENAERVFDRYLSFDKQLKDAIIELNGGDTPEWGWYKYETSSRATTVPKSATARRFISVENTANMFLQQGLMSVMYKRLRHVGLDVKVLPKMHQWLARHGSITGSFATIDWASASDCVSSVLVEWLLPQDWKWAINIVRSPYTLIGDEEVELEMVSTMGNATTFPLETLVFWAFACATQCTLEGSSLFPYPDWDEVNDCSVFGDDCIVPTHIAPTFISVVTSIGFIINDEKSFYDGPMRFRESCGGDFLCGVDVRPFFVKAPHTRSMASLEPWLYIMTNALLKKYRTYFGELSYVYDKELWRVLFGVFAEYKLNIKLVPADFPDDAGLKLSHDILRFKRHYPMKLSRIDRSQHGTYRFQYCKFRYRNTRVQSDGTLYALWLKTPRFDLNKQVVLAGETLTVRTGEEIEYLERDAHKLTPIRRNGGYVVAVSHTSHWDVPSVKEGR